MARVVEVTELPTTVYIAVFFAGRNPRVEGKVISVASPAITGGCLSELQMERRPSTEKVGTLPYRHRTPYIPSEPYHTPPHYACCHHGLERRQQQAEGRSTQSSKHSPSSSFPPAFHHHRGPHQHHRQCRSQAPRPWRSGRRSDPQQGDRSLYRKDKEENKQESCSLSNSPTAREEDCQTR